MGKKKGSGAAPRKGGKGAARGQSSAVYAPVKTPTKAVAKTPALTLIVIGVAAAVAFVLVFGWTAEAALVLAPLFAGAFVAMSVRRPVVAAAVAGAAGLVGAWVSTWAYSMANYTALVNGGPKYAYQDIPRKTWDVVAALMQRNPINTMGQPATAITVLVGALAAAAVAFGVARMLERVRDRETAKRIVALALVAVTVVGFVWIGLTMSADYRARANHEPQAGEYAFDATIYLKTYYNMVHGQGYYDALLNAAAGDSRIIEQNAVRDGKYYPGWMWGPAAARRPTIFYVWRYLAPGGGGSVIVLAVLLAAGVLGTIYWGLEPYLSHRAAFVPAFAAPYCVLMTAGLNPFFPDYWATLFLVIALALVMRKKWIAGAAVMFLGAVTRETLGPALAVLALVSLVIWIRRSRPKEWLVRGGVFAGLTVLWYALERVHEAIGMKYMGFEPMSTTTMLWQTATTRNLSQKVLWATSYLIFPYGFYKIRGIFLAGLAPIGFWAVLAPEKEVRFAVVTYTTFWIVFLFTVGATSSYWGQMIMLPSLIGVACLLVAADRLNRRLELSEPIT